MTNGKPRRTKFPANLVGPQIRRLRAARGWSQTKLALRLQLSGLNIGREVLAQIEAQTHCLKDKDILYFAHALKVDLADLYFRNLRQSRRLDGGGAAQLKAAWPFGQKFRRPVPNIAPTPPQSFLPELLETLDHFKSVLSACPSTKLPTAQFSTSDTAIHPFSHTPGTVKLCESSGRAGGFPVD
jgi:transcriptional regulator with XRE-family HTH domain